MRVQVTWDKSVSTDVVSQELVYNVNDGEAVVNVLDASAGDYIFGNVNEADKLSVILRAFNGKKYSLPLMGEYVVPVVPVPDAPTNLVFTTLED